MNGRVYDPILGRMLSPDNYVQDPLNPQDYNRYTYCRNNPLIYTDPSGNNALAWVLGGLIIVAKNYMEGYKANHNQLNPITWNWSNASFSIGVGGTSGGAYDISLGIGWGNTPMLMGYSSNGGFGFGYSQNGTSNMAFPSLESRIDAAFAKTSNYLDDIPSYLPVTGSFLSSQNSYGFAHSQWANGNYGSAALGYADGFCGSILCAAEIVSFGSLSAMKLGTQATEASLEAGSRAFFSGAGTEAQAINAGYSTLGKTDAGLNLSRMTEGMEYYGPVNGQPASQAWQWWARLSETYAKGIPN